MAKTHEVKSWPEFFEAVASGSKTFEVRINDRGYAVGDRLWLREWQPDEEGGDYTGRELVVDVTYMLDAGPGIILRGIAPDYVVMAIRPPYRHGDEAVQEARATAICPECGGDPADGTGYHAHDCSRR